MSRSQTATTTRLTLNSTPILLALFSRAANSGLCPAGYKTFQVHKPDQEDSVIFNSIVPKLKLIYLFVFSHYFFRPEAGATFGMIQQHGRRSSSTTDTSLLHQTYRFSFHSVKSQKTNVKFRDIPFFKFITLQNSNSTHGHHDTITVQITCNLLLRCIVIIPSTGLQTILCQ